MCVEFFGSLRKIYLYESDGFHCVLVFIAGSTGRNRTDGFTALQAVALDHSATVLYLEQDARIELASSVWKTVIIPLY